MCPLLIGIFLRSIRGCYVGCYLEIQILKCSRKESYLIINGVAPISAKIDFSISQKKKIVCLNEKNKNVLQYCQKNKHDFFSK